MRVRKASVLRNALLGLGAIAILSFGGMTAFGQNTGNNSMNGNDVVPPADQPIEPLPEVQPETPATPAPAVNAAAPTYGPLMHALEDLGIGKPMEDLGFNIGGHIEAGYFYDFTEPSNQTPPRSNPGTLILFPGDYKNEFMLNQLSLKIERDMINLPKGQWDLGGLIEMGYGRDYFYVHSNGMFDNHNKQGGTGNDDQYDITQLYGQVGIPVGTGLTVEFGKTVSFLGIEKIDPTENIFYTHSYGFSYGEPFTVTGVFGSYTFGDVTNNNTTTLTGGISRGWNQSIYDNNGDIDGIIQLKSHLGSVSWTFNLMLGPEGVLPYGPPDHSHWWVTPEGIATWNLSDQFSLSADILYGNYPSVTQWFSAAFYAQYKFDPHVSAAVRAEYYHDGRGVTTGVGGTDINFCEITLGTTIVPLPDSPFLQTFSIRPEVRWDTADQAVFDGTNRNQFTAAFDILYKY